MSTHKALPDATAEPRRGQQLGTTSTAEPRRGPGVDATTTLRGAELVRELLQERAELQGELDAQRERLAGMLGHVVPAPMVTAMRGSHADRPSEDFLENRHEQFLSTFSHELRTPLNAILGWASLLRGNQLSDTSRARAVATIERNAMILAKLVDDTLDMSRIVAGNLRVQCRNTELAPLIEAARDSVRVAADAKQVRIVLELDPSAGIVFGDPDRLEQVIWNLLSNAVKFTPAGGKIDVRLDRPTDRALRIAVRDTGKGFSPDFASSLFTRFTQAESGTRRSHGGLGLGLAIVKHLVEMHDGSVAASSAGEGCGATFTVLLPRHVEPTEAHGASFLITSPSLEGVRVLLVDDEPDARELLTAVLVRDGAQVATASGTTEALALLAKWRPDILVSDIGMPTSDGYDLIHAVRSLDPRHGGTIPAGALTAYGTQHDSRLALQAGFQVHVPKPVTPSELISMVLRLRALKAETQQHQALR